MPKFLRITQVVVIIQVLLNLGLNGFVLVLLSQESDRAWARNNLALQALILVASMLIMVLLLVSALRFGRGEPWARTTALAVEWIVVGGALLNLAGGALLGQFTPQALVPLVFAVLVLQALLKPEARESFARELREWTGDQRQ
ncbi:MULTISPECIES: hypothetical protein [unclassified Crossiella]|uniref:hypothetical protein n=1 Tax=unclassified Crossiella TaxID=2620835 RepID=UPI001FFE4522|nr:MULTISPECIES: hypothetical protein [unclassified Crossiella]MCK2241047.1 hypothetical protein [Crossiella sp. S99.2]MCK2253809.1 hypothetical protein [Crossiella sp. S99.1]